MLYLFILACIALGTLMLLYPETLFKLEFLFDLKNGTPTEFYITKIRMNGTILVIGGILALFIAFIYNIDWYAIL